MATPERPRLVGCDISTSGGREPRLRISNRDGFSDQYLETPLVFQYILQYFDGNHTVEEISHLVSEDSGVRLTAGKVREIAEALDSICVIAGPNYDAAKQAAVTEYRSSGVREPICAGGSYSDDPGRLKDQMKGLFVHPRGASLPSDAPPRDELRAVLAPHIDYRRGGPSYGWAYRAIAERTDADLFVIVATSHYSAHRYILTRNHFRTPLGVARTDHAFVDALAEAYGQEAAYADELAHRPEHSIELEVVLLQFVLGGKRDFSIVPLLVGSLYDFVSSGEAPGEGSEVERMTAALREIERDSGRKVCYLVSGDLAHVGPKFDDERRVDAAWAAEVRRGDAAYLEAAAKSDPATLFSNVAADGDERRLCGFPPTYAMLKAAAPGKGELLLHDQFVDPNGHELVGFASMAFGHAT